MFLKGKNALVTGAAKRVGHAIALKLAQNGANILLHYRHSKNEALDALSEIRALGVEAYLFQADLSKDSEIRKMVSEIKAMRLTVDILVNSASLYYKTPKESLTEKDWD